MARAVGMMATCVATAARELYVQLRIGAKIQEFEGAVRVLSTSLEERLGVISTLLLHPAGNPCVPTLSLPGTRIAALPGHLFLTRKAACERIEAVSKDIQVIDIGRTQRRGAVRQFDGGRLALSLTA